MATRVGTWRGALPGSPSSPPSPRPIVYTSPASVNTTECDAPASARRTGVPASASAPRHPPRREERVDLAHRVGGGAVVQAELAVHSVAPRVALAAHGDGERVVVARAHLAHRVRHARHSRRPQLGVDVDLAGRRHLAVAERAVVDAAPRPQPAELVDGRAVRAAGAHLDDAAREAGHRRGCSRLVPRPLSPSPSSPKPLAPSGTPPTPSAGGSGRGRAHLEDGISQEAYGAPIREAIGTGSRYSSWPRPSWQHWRRTPRRSPRRRARAVLVACSHLHPGLGEVGIVDEAGPQLGHPAEVAERRVWSRARVVGIVAARVRPAAGDAERVVAAGGDRARRGRAPPAPPRASGGLGAAARRRAEAAAAR